jgi:lactate permease
MSESSRIVRQEGTILRAVFWHGIALACLVDVLVLLQAYVFPWMIAAH